MPSFHHDLGIVAVVRMNIAVDVLLLILVKCSTFSLGFIRNTKKFPLGFVVFILVFLSVLSNKQQFFVLVLSEKTIISCVSQRKCLLLHQISNK